MRSRSRQMGGIPGRREPRAWVGHAVAFGPALSFGLPGRTNGASGSAAAAAPAARLRLAAWAVDSAILGLAGATVWQLMHAYGPSGGGQISGLAAALVATLAALLVDSLLPATATGWAGTALLAVACWPLLAVPYYALSEGLFGATVGKRLLGLSVATRAGARRPGILRALVRALLRPVDALCLGLVGLVVAKSAGDGRRLGDLAAGTVVRPADAPADEEVRARKIKVGLDAEREVRAVLSPLADEGRYVFFNVEHPHFGDIDALVIGPDGVAIIEVKGHKGFVSVQAETGELLRDGAPFEKDLLAQVRRQTAHVARTLGIYRGPGDDPSGLYAHTPMRPWLVFTRAELVPSGRGDFPAEACTLAVLRDHFYSRPSGGASPSLDAWGARALALRVQEAYGAYPIAPRGHANNPSASPPENPEGV